MPKREKDAFESDELIQTWVVYHLTVIGEACRTLPEDFQAAYASVPWRDLPELKLNLQAILKGF